MCRALSSISIVPTRHRSGPRNQHEVRGGDVIAVPHRVRVVRVRACSHELLCVSAEPSTRSCIRAERQATRVSRAPSLARVATRPFLRPRATCHAVAVATL